MAKINPDRLVAALTARLRGNPKALLAAMRHATILQRAVTNLKGALQALNEAFDQASLDAAKRRLELVVETERKDMVAASADLAEPAKLVADVLTVIAAAYEV